AVEEKYGKSYTAGLGVPKTRLELDDEVIKFFGLTPVTALQEVVKISLSYEEIDKTKVSDDVKAALMAGRVLTDQMEKFPLEGLIEATSRALGDMRMAHGAVLEALQLGFLTVLEKAPTPKEEEMVLEIKPEPEIVETKEEEFFEKYYESTLSLVDIDLSKDVKGEERLVLKYVRAYNEQVGKGIKGETLIEGLKEEFKDDEKKVIKTLKKTLKSGYLQETPEEGLIVVTEGVITEKEKLEPEKIEKVKKEKKNGEDKELLERSYGTSLSLAEIDSEKLDSDVRKVLKYVRSYFDQVGVGITGKNVIEYMQKEFEVDEKKAMKIFKKALKTGYLQ
ncbi:MAG: hypothetical protein Q6362_007075, partial [Candidatus Wukongarchaeota archaeon]|nr:hypothetical protein [Candidatus Wukongarchaeota archaeon]